MRAVIQKVTRAAVRVDNEVVSSIGQGICVLIGITHDDNDDDLKYIVNKILSVKLFEDDQGRMWRKSARDLGLEILCVSQFTLYCKLKTNKPDFHMAMKADEAAAMYARVLAAVEEGHDASKVKNGQFGAMMRVEIENDGPVTIELDSNAKYPVGKPTEE